MAGITKLNVVYQGWGESWRLGTLAEAGGKLLFEYSAQAIERGLQLSPIKLPLPRPGAAPAAYVGPAQFLGLPGFIADSLPDGWGMLLMDRLLRRAGRDPHTVSVLDRLAIIGHSAIGALAFEPADEIEMQQAGVVQIAALAREVEAMASDKGEEASAEQLRRLLLLGGSPQGARPKALVRWRRDVDVFAQDNAGMRSGEPWLIKFPSGNEHPDVCALEEFYARLAREGGMDIPQTTFFNLGSAYAAFGTRRFDRVVAPDGTEVRAPVLSLAALLDADYRLPSLDYETLLLATTRVTGDYRETRKAFERCVFNVLTHNRDDHAKNFAFRMDADGRWKLSPAFDLSFSQGPGGEHSTSVSGEGRAPSRAHLMQVAKRGGVKEADADECIGHWLDALRPNERLLKDLPVRRATLNAMRATLTDVWKNFDPMPR